MEKKNKELDEVKVHKVEKKKMSKQPKEKYDVPFTKIVICIGTMKSPICSFFPIRVWINGEKIESLRGFKFSAKRNKPPVIRIERYMD